MTRAKKELIFTRPTGKDNKPYIDSPFILEVGTSPQPSTLQERELDSSLVDIFKKELL